MEFTIQVTIILFELQIVSNETVTEDPETGTKKRTVVTERVVTTKTFHAIPIDDDLNQSMNMFNETAILHPDHSKMSSATELAYKDAEISSLLSPELSPVATVRVIELNHNPFHDVDYDQVANLIIITRVKPDSAVKVFFFSY